MHNDAGNGLPYVAIWLLQWTSLLTIGFHTRSWIDSLVWILTEHISGAKNISEKGKFASPDHNERKNVCEEWSSLLPRNCDQRQAVSGDGQWAEAARQSWQLLRKKQLQLTDYDVVELRNWRRHLEPQWKVWWGCEDGAQARTSWGLNSRSNRGTALYVWPSPSGEWWRDKQQLAASEQRRDLSRGEAELISFGKAAPTAHLPSAASCGAPLWLFTLPEWQVAIQILWASAAATKILKQFQQNVFEAFGKPYVEGALVLNITFCSDSILQCNLHNVWPSSMGNMQAL